MFKNILKLEKFATVHTDLYCLQHESKIFQQSLAKHSGDYIGSKLATDYNGLVRH
jgi:hypothetical protein